MPFRLAIGLRTAFANLRTKPNSANHLHMARPSDGPPALSRALLLTLEILAKIGAGVVHRVVVDWLTV